MPNSRTQQQEDDLPTYAYACTACEHRFETQQAFTDDALTECPECAGRLRKLFNSVGIVFKGSGFYRTDSRGAAGTDGGSTSSNGSDKGSEKGSDKGSSSSSDKSSSGSSEKASGSGDKGSSGGSSDGGSSSGSAAASSGSSSGSKAGASGGPSTSAA